MKKQSGFFSDDEGNISYAAQESAGYFYYFKTPEGQTQAILFSGLNDKTGAVEYEYATFVRADYGLCNPKAWVAEKLANADKFLAKVAKVGPESSAEAALRSAVKETNGAIKRGPVNKAKCDILTTPHKFWCAATDAQSKITIYPYEVTSKQLAALKATKFTQFPGGIVLGTLSLDNGKPKFMVDGVNVLEADNMGKLRGFNKTLLKFYEGAMHGMLANIVTAPSVHAKMGFGHSLFSKSAHAPAATEGRFSQAIKRIFHH